MIISDPNSPEFNSYASFEDLRAFAKLRLYELPDDEKEQSALLIQAMDYLESMKWKGKRKDVNQPLAWPRVYVVVDGVPIDPSSIPKKLIAAQCRLAIEAQEVDLTPTLGGEVISERVEGAVSVTYAEGTNSGAPEFSWLSGLLDGLIATGSGGIVNVMRG